MDVLVVETNKVPAMPVRGAGYPEGAFAMERTLDAIARHLKIDRTEVRRRNLIVPGQMPYTSPLKSRSGSAVMYDSGDFPETMQIALDAIDYDGFAKRQEAARRAAAISASPSPTASREPAEGRLNPRSFALAGPGGFRSTPALPRWGRA